MAIYEPLPKVSTTDRRLLQLIIELLTYQLDRGVASNLDEDKIPLTDAEARELAKLLLKLVESREFQEKIFIAESFAAPDQNKLTAAKKIYLAARHKVGRTKIMASVHWNDLLIRVGLTKEAEQYQTTSKPMSFDHFKKMETRLFKSLGIPSKIVNLLTKILVSARIEIDQVRTGEKRENLKIMNQVLVPLLKVVNSREWHRLAEQYLTTIDLSAATILVANTSVLFTTRDWNSTGTISTMASALVTLKKR